MLPELRGGIWKNRRKRGFVFVDSMVIRRVQRLNENCILFILIHRASKYHWFPDSCRITQECIQSIRRAFQFIENYQIRRIQIIESNLVPSLRITGPTIFGDGLRCMIGLHLFYHPLLLAWNLMPAEQNVYYQN